MSPSSGSGRANRAHLALAPNAALALACGVVALLAVLSLFIGVSPVSPFDFAPGGAALGGDRAAQVVRGGEIFGHWSGGDLRSRAE